MIFRGKFLKWWGKTVESNTLEDRDGRVYATVHWMSAEKYSPESANTSANVKPTGDFMDTPTDYCRIDAHSPETILEAMEWCERTLLDDMPNNKWRVK